MARTMVRRRRSGGRARARGRSRTRGHNPSGYIAIPRLMRRRRGRFVKTGRLTRRNPGRVRHRKSGRRRGKNPRGYIAIPRVSRRRLHRSSHRVRRNPYHRRSMRIHRNPVDTITGVFKEAFSGQTIETVIGTGLGFGGTLVGAKLVHTNLIPDLGTSPIGRVAVTAGVGILGSGLLAMITGDSKLGARALVGSLLATLWVGVSEVVRGTKAADIIPTLGAGPETAAFQKAIQDEVLREMRGGARRSAEGMSVYLPAAGINYVPAAGSQAYLTGREGARAEQRRAGMSAYLTGKNLRDAESGLGQIADEFTSAGMPERF